MTRKSLESLGLPRTSYDFALQSWHSACRRRLQQAPGHGPAAAPNEEPVAHYVGPAGETVLGAEPENLLYPEIVGRTVK